jgi:hypothetical protein
MLCSHLCTNKYHMLFELYALGMRSERFKKNNNFEGIKVERKEKN